MGKDERVCMYLEIMFQVMGCTFLPSRALESGLDWYFRLSSDLV